MTESDLMIFIQRIVLTCEPAKAQMILEQLSKTLRSQNADSTVVELADLAKNSFPEVKREASVPTLLPRQIRDAAERAERRRRIEAERRYYGRC